jgi:hypothetical protein
LRLHDNQFVVPKLVDEAVFVGDPARPLRIMEHFGTTSVLDVTAALHFGELPHSRLLELVPVLLRVAAASDGPAKAIVERLAEEVLLLVGAALDRLGLRDQPTDVVLGAACSLGRIPSSGD